MNSNLTELEVITLFAKFEDENNSVGFVNYDSVADDDNSETDWQKEHRKQLEKANNKYIGWKILNLKTCEIEDISYCGNEEEIKNPYKTLDRLAKLYIKYGLDYIPVSIETAYSNLISLLIKGYYLK